MIVNAKLSIGYPTAMVEDQLEIDDKLLEGLTKEEREHKIYEEVAVWANEYIEYGYEEEEL